MQNTLSPHGKPKISELRRRLEFVKASFAIEGLEFTEAELKAFEVCIRRRLSGEGMRKYFDRHLSTRSAA